MEDRFNKKIAIITGSAKGMGKATAEMLAKEGAIVVLTDIDKKGLDVTAKEFIDKKYKVFPIIADISKRTEVERIINTVISKYERIDILVNNAGVLLSSSIEDTTDQMIDLTIDVNIKALLYTIRAVAPIMKRQKLWKNC